MEYINYNGQAMNDLVFNLYVLDDYQSALSVTGDPVVHQSFGFSQPQHLMLIDSIFTSTAPPTNFNFNLMNNLNLTTYDYDGSATTANIKSIGGTYAGYFDGGGYSIANFNSLTGGLFDILGTGATIANLNLDSTVINQTRQQATGGIANYVAGNASFRSVSVTNSAISSTLNVG